MWLGFLFRPNIVAHCDTHDWSRGNWGVDLQAGSEFGYKLLSVVLMAGLIAVFMQVCYLYALKSWLT